MSVIYRPSHAYIPGVNERHPDGAFDSLKVGIATGMSEDEMQRSLAWHAGQLYRAEGYFWECHEVLEPLWMAAEEGPVRSYLQAVIQMANAQLKEKMGKPNAAIRLCDIVCAHLDVCTTRDVVLGQPVDALRVEAQELSFQQEKTQ